MSNCASTTKQRRTVQKVPRVSNEFLERASDGHAAGPLHAAADNLILHPSGPEAYQKTQTGSSTSTTKAMALCLQGRAAPRESNARAAGPLHAAAAQAHAPPGPTFHALFGS